MESKEFNERIAKLDGVENKPYESFGEKVIPYTGWYWRTVNFDAPTMQFGVIPAGTEEALSPVNDKPLVGFMQNNKWGYDYVYASAIEWFNIRSQIETALLSMRKEDFAKANELIQALADGKHNWRVA